MSELFIEVFLCSLSCRSSPGQSDLWLLATVHIGYIKMILEALFLTGLVMSSFYMCEVVNEVSSSKSVEGFDDEVYEEREEIPPEIGPEEDPSIETIFTITLILKDDDEKVVEEDRSSEEDAGEKESFLERQGKGPMRLHFRVAWRENPLFGE